MRGIPALGTRGTRCIMWPQAAASAAALAPCVRPRWKWPYFEGRCCQIPGGAALLTTWRYSGRLDCRTEFEAGMCIEVRVSIQLAYEFGLNIPCKKVKKYEKWKFII